MAHIGQWILVLWQDFKAWRSGLRRVAPRFGPNGVRTRGRIYITARHYNKDGRLLAVHTTKTTKEL